MALLYVGITIMVLYLKSFIFSPVIQIIGFFVLTSGYTIPLLLLISQRYTEAGLAPLLAREEQRLPGEESMDGPDLSFTNLNNGTKQKPSPEGKKPMGGSYFKDYYGSKTERTSSEPKAKGLFWLLAVPYFTMLLIFVCYFLILYSPVRTILDRSNSSDAT